MHVVGTEGDRLQVEEERQGLGDVQLELVPKTLGLARPVNGLRRLARRPLVRQVASEIGHPAHRFGVLHAEDDPELVVAMDEARPVHAGFQPDLVEQLVVVGDLVLGLEREGALLDDHQRPGQVLVFQLGVNRVGRIFHPRVDVLGKQVDVRLGGPLGEFADHFVDPAQRRPVQRFREVHVPARVDAQKAAEPRQVNVDRILVPCKLRDGRGVDLGGTGEFCSGSIVLVLEGLHARLAVRGDQLLVVFKISPVAQERPAEGDHLPGIRVLVDSLVDHFNCGLVSVADHIERFLLVASRARGFLHVHGSPPGGETFGHLADHVEKRVLIHFSHRSKNPLKVAPAVDLGLVVADVERVDDQLGVSGADTVLAEQVHHRGQVVDVLLHHDRRDHDPRVGRQAVLLADRLGHVRIVPAGPLFQVRFGQRDAGVEVAPGKLDDQLDRLVVPIAHQDGLGKTDVDLLPTGGRKRLGPGAVGRRLQQIGGGHVRVSALMIGGGRLLGRPVFERVLRLADPPVGQHQRHLVPRRLGEIGHLAHAFEQAFLGLEVVRPELDVLVVDLRLRAFAERGGQSQYGLGVLPGQREDPRPGGRRRRPTQQVGQGVDGLLLLRRVGPRIVEHRNVLPPEIGHLSLLELVQVFLRGQKLHDLLADLEILEPAGLVERGEVRAGQVVEVGVEEDSAGHQAPLGVAPQSTCALLQRPLQPQLLILRHGDAKHQAELPDLLGGHLARAGVGQAQEIVECEDRHVAPRQVGEHLVVDVRVQRLGQPLQRLADFVPATLVEGADEPVLRVDLVFVGLGVARQVVEHSRRVTIKRPAGQRAVLLVEHGRIVLVRFGGTRRRQRRQQQQGQKQKERERESLSHRLLIVGGLGVFLTFALCGYDPSISTSENSTWISRSSSVSSGTIGWTGSGANSSAAAAADPPPPPPPGCGSVGGSCICKTVSRF